MALIKLNNRSSEDTAIHGRRNLIINGDAQIWQRATSSSSTGVNSADRWYHAEGTFSQETSIVPDNFQYAIKCVTNASNTPLLLQKIERPQVCGHIIGQDITISFYARSSNVNAITKLELNDEGGSGGRPDGGAQTLSAADTWERITHTFTAPFSSLTGNSVAAILTFANSATVYITGFQVEVGDTATPYEHRNYTEELVDCERYFQLLRAGSVGTAENASRASFGHRCHTGMRIAPTISLDATRGHLNQPQGGPNQKTTMNSIFWGVTQSEHGGFLVIDTSDSWMTAGRLIFTAGTTGMVKFDAEL